MTDFASLLRVLAEAKVEFVVVGGAASTAHGSARLTDDLDVVYRRTRENAERIATALEPFRPCLRGAPFGLPFQFDAETIERGLNFPLVTLLGDLDAFGEIPLGGSYEELLPHAVPLHAFGVDFRCLGLERLIQVKRASGRPRDLEAVAELTALREERAAGR